MTTFDPFGDVDGDERACRVCGCTEARACVSRRHGPCWWVEYDLCSHCAMKGERARYLLIFAGVLVASALMALAFWLGQAQAWHGGRLG